MTDAGIITINDPEPNDWHRDFAFVYLSASQALISQMDLGAAATGASATGTMGFCRRVRQAPSGGYAFVVNGTEISKTLPLAFGGGVECHRLAQHNFSGSSGVVDEILLPRSKMQQPAWGFPGTLYPVPISSVRGDNQFDCGLPARKTILSRFSSQVTSWTPIHIKLIESDKHCRHSRFWSDRRTPLSAREQPRAHLKHNTALSGTYVYGVTGVDLE